MNDTTTLPAPSEAAQGQGAPMTGADVAVRAAGIGRGLVDPIPHLDIGTLPVLDPKNGVLPKGEETVVPTQTDEFGSLSIVKKDSTDTPSTEANAPDNTEQEPSAEVSMTAWPGADADVADEPTDSVDTESADKELAVSEPEEPAETAMTSESEEQNPMDSSSDQLPEVVHMPEQPNDMPMPSTEVSSVPSQIPETSASVPEASATTPPTTTTTPTVSVSVPQTPEV